MNEAAWLASEFLEPMLYFAAGRTDFGQLPGLGLPQPPGTRTASGRKLRLFACAAMRTALHLVWEPWRGLVAVAERWADGEAADEERQEALVAMTRGGHPPVMIPVPGQPGSERSDPNANEPDHALRSALGDGDALEDAQQCFRHALTVLVWEAAGGASGGFAAIMQGQLPSTLPFQAALCAALREIVNPFHPGTVDPACLAWRDATVPKMARTIYRERRWEELPVLADALEESGCTDADILRHCRGLTKCPNCLGKAEVDVRVPADWRDVSPDPNDPGERQVVRCVRCGGKGWVPTGPHYLGCWALDAVLGRS